MTRSNSATPLVVLVLMLWALQFVCFPVLDGTPMPGQEGYGEIV